jgi:hypothetical protein
MEEGSRRFANWLLVRYVLARFSIGDRAVAHRVLREQCRFIAGSRRDYVRAWLHALAPRAVAKAVRSARASSAARRP